MRVVVLGAVLGAVALVGAGCGSSDDEGSAAGAKSGSDSAGKPAKIAYLAPALTDYQTAQQKGMETAVAPGGGSVKVFNANWDGQKQQQQCQDAVTSQRFNVIVLGAVPGTGTPCVTIAKAADIPVVTDGFLGEELNDINPQVEGVVGTVTITPKANADAEVELAQAACKDLDPCNIIAEVATPNDPWSTGAVDAIKERVPNAKVVQTFAGNFDPSQVSSKLPPMLAAHRDTNVIVFSADIQAIAAIPIVKQAGLAGKVKILGSGASRAGVAAVMDGTLFGTTGNFPETTGEVLGKMAVQAANGEPVDPKGVDALTLGEPLVLTKDNAAGFEAQWGPAHEAG